MNVSSVLFFLLNIGIFIEYCYSWFISIYDLEDLTSYSRLLHF